MPNMANIERSITEEVGHGNPCHVTFHSKPVTVRPHTLHHVVYIAQCIRHMHVCAELWIPTMADGFSPCPIWPRLSSRGLSVSSTSRGSTPSVVCVPEKPPKLWPGHSTNSQSGSHCNTPSRLTGEKCTEDATDSL